MNLDILIITDHIGSLLGYLAAYNNYMGVN